MCGSLFFALLSNFAAYLVTLAADVIVNIASHDRTRIAGFPDFLFNHFIKFLHILPAFSFIDYASLYY